MQLTIEIPDDLAERVKAQREHLGEIIERGLEAARSGSTALAREVISFFARGPQSQEIVAFQPSPESLQRATELLEKNRAGSLTPQERNELDEMAALNHLFIRIKAEARRHVQGTAGRPA